MRPLKIQTHNPKNPKSEFEFYALSKGLNSGKPLDEPCPNCFTISCRNAREMDLLRSLLFGLWKSKAFHPFLFGSVIPFIRISDFRTFVSKQFQNLKDKETAFQTDVQKFKALEQKERAMYEQLLLISELKRIYIARHLKR
jgi:hypothetical protein